MMFHCVVLLSLAAAFIGSRETLSARIARQDLISESTTSGVVPTAAERNVDIQPAEPTFALRYGGFHYWCIVSRAELNTVEWYHNGQLLLADDPRVFITNTTINSTHLKNRLYVRPVVREDGGDYYCRAVFADGGAVESNTTYLRILGVFSVDVEVDYYEVALGSTIHVNCSAQGDPEPIRYWLKKAEIRDYSRITVLADPTSAYVLDLNVTDPDDAGEWWCVALNIASWGETATFTIVVIDPPTSTTASLLTAKPVRMDTDFELLCTTNSTASNRPIFSWLHNGVRNLTELSKQPHSRYSSHEVDKLTERLVVRGVTYADRGTYSCVVTNMAGSDSGNVTIAVEGAPEILRDEIPPLIKVGKQRVYVDCPSLCNPPPTHVEWSKRSVAMESTDQVEVTVFLNNGTLYMSSVEIEDSGPFTCHISNQYGADSWTFSLLVMERPDPPTNFTITPSGCGSTLGDCDQSVELTWTAPIVTSRHKVFDDYVLEWSENGGSFHVLDFVIDINITNTSLDVASFSPGVAHVFRLRARNVGGLSEPSNSQTYKVIVQGRTLHYIYINVCVLIGVSLCVLVILLVMLPLWNRHNGRRKLKANDASISAKVETDRERQLFQILNQSSNLHMYAVPNAT